MSIRSFVVSRATFCVSVFFTITASGCATEPPPRPVALDPSNPAAPEAAPLDAGAVSQIVLSPKAAKPDGAAATVYTCPMHPEVEAHEPGRCPKCGMTLVPKPPSEGKP